MKLIPFYITIIIIMFSLAASLDEQELEVQEKLAAEYAEMLKAEAACKDWPCITNLEH